ncbi:MAG: diguanylate cyclase domain-containing protein [Lachnospiraceae bacterium]
MNSQNHLINEVDTLTGLRRSYAFLNTLTRIANEKKQCEVMLIGIDNFRTINNLYTYAFGNQVIQNLGQSIQEVLPPSAEVFRLDGDNFGIICMGEKVKQCETIFRKISKQAQWIDDIFISFTLSAGICSCPDFCGDGDELFANVGLALEQAKIGTKHCCHYYTPDISDRIKSDMFLLERLRISIANGFEGFELYYQPIMNQDEKTIYGCEALLRFFDKHFQEGVSPYRFVPLLERSGLILEVGRWVINAAIAQCAKWKQLAPDFCININIAASQLDDIDFPDYIIKVATKYKVPANSIILELTESEQTAFEKIRTFFDCMRKNGFQTALDDFGTGYASLDIFRQVSADELKIDRSFLERITDNVTDQILLKTILDMCRKMNIMVCVEGIEDDDIEHVVSQMNPHLLQGYKYGRPVGAIEFEYYYLKNHEPEKVEVEEVTADSPFSYTKHRPAQPMSLSAIVNNAYSGIFQVGMDQEFTFLTCNEGYRRMLGYTAREMEEKFENKALGFVHPDDTEWVNQEILRQLKQGDTINIEFRIVRADGRPIWILGTGNVVRTSEGNPSLIVNIIENDKRKRENLANYKELESYRKILELLPTGIKCIRYDADFTIEYISPGFLSMLGYTKEEIFGQFEGKYINLVFEEDRSNAINEVLEQLQTSDVVHLRYRTICKDGRIVWLETISRLFEKDQDGIQRCYSSVVNITETITEEVKNYSLNIYNRLQKAAKLWGEVLYEYNFVSKQLVVSESFSSMFGYDVPENGVIDSEIIFRGKNKTLIAFFEQAYKGKEPTPIELPAICKDETVIWCRILVHTPEKIGGENISVIGKIINVDVEYKEREKLRVASQTDSLTGLFNKGSVDLNIADKLSENPDFTYICWVLDVDDFKIINDSMGHFAGDKLLVTIGERLRKCFRKTDIVGRIGGDEFLVFATGSSEFDWQIEKANQLIESLQAPINLNDQEIRPSISIGISCYPKDGKNFNELYQNADKALYRAKAAGKNNYCFF